MGRWWQRPPPRYLRQAWLTVPNLPPSNPPQRLLSRLSQRPRPPPFARPALPTPLSPRRHPYLPRLTACSRALWPRLSPPTRAMTFHAHHTPHHVLRQIRTHPAFPPPPAPLPPPTPPQRLLSRQGQRPRPPPFARPALPTPLSPRRHPYLPRLTALSRALWSSRSPPPRAMTFHAHRSRHRVLRRIRRNAAWPPQPAALQPLIWSSWAAS